MTAQYMNGTTRTEKWKGMTAGVITKANLTPMTAGYLSQPRQPGGLSHDDGDTTGCRV